MKKPDLIISKTVATDADASRALDVIEEAFRSISGTVTRDAQVVIAEYINTNAFGSGLKKDVTRVTAKESQAGLLVTAENNYRVSTLYIICGITCVLVFIPGCFLLGWLRHRNKNLVKKEIEQALQRVNDQLAHGSRMPIRKQPQPSNGIASEIAQLSDLHKRGMLSATEFESAKMRLLGNETSSRAGDDLILHAPDEDPIVFIKREGKVSSKQFRKSHLRKNIEQLRDSDELGLSASGPWLRKKSFFGDTSS